MQLMIKSLPFEVKELDEASRSFWAVASDESVDRSGDIIRQAGWELANFMKNPVIPWGHDYSQPPVAMAEAAEVRDGKLYIKPKFATAEQYPFADQIYQLYKGGFLRAFSVGFMPKEHKYMMDGDRYVGTEFLRQELFEVSAVTVPANPNALAQARAAGLVVPKELEQPSALERLEALEAKLKDWPPVIEELEASMGEVQFVTPADLAKALDELADRTILPPGEFAARLAEVKALVEALSAAQPPQPQPEPKAIDPATLARAFGAAAEKRLTEIVTNRLNYHLGRV